jgi:hypothetical protein
VRCADAATWCNILHLNICQDELAAVQLQEGEAALLAQFLLPAGADDAGVGQHQLLPLPALAGRVEHHQAHADADLRSRQAHAVVPVGHITGSHISGARLAAGARHSGIAAVTR